MRGSTRESNWESFTRGGNPSPVSIALCAIDPPSPTRGEGKRVLPLSPRRTSPVLQRRPDAARQAEAIDRGRGSQRLEAMQFDAAPLEAAFLQNVAGGR